MQFSSLLVMSVCAASLIVGTAAAPTKRQVRLCVEKMIKTKVSTQIQPVMFNNKLDSFMSGGADSRTIDDLALPKFTKCDNDDQRTLAANVDNSCAVAMLHAAFDTVTNTVTKTPMPEMAATAAAEKVKTAAEKPIKGCTEPEPKERATTL